MQRFVLIMLTFPVNIFYYKNFIIISYQCKMIQSKLSPVLIVVLLLVTQTTCITQSISSRLHRYYNDDPYYHGSGVSKFAALIIGIIGGILCFLGIMYYFKWRRQTGGQFSFFDMFTRRTNPQAPVQYGHPGQPHYVNSPQVPQTQNQGAPGYYNNPSYPNYPPL